MGLCFRCRGIAIDDAWAERGENGEANEVVQRLRRDANRVTGMTTYLRMIQNSVP